MRLELALIRLQRRLERMDAWIATRWHRGVAKAVTAAMIADRARAETEAETAIPLTAEGEAVVAYPVQGGVVAVEVPGSYVELTPARAMELAGVLARAASIAEGG